MTTEEKEASAVASQKMSLIYLKQNDDAAALRKLKEALSYAKGTGLERQLRVEMEEVKNLHRGGKKNRV